MNRDPIRAHFEARAATWDDHAPPDLDARLRRLLAPFADRFGKARLILELGTGTGACIPHLCAYAPRAQLVALDLAFAMLTRARLRRSGVYVAQADAHRLPFPSAGENGGFDMVVCHNSFPHFQDKLRALQEIRRVLRRGGSVLIVHHMSRPEVNAVHRRIGEPVASDTLPTAQEMQQLLAQAGYTRAWVEDAATHYTAHAARP